MQLSDRITKLLEIAMPQFAESIVEATIGKWLKKPGDPIQEYEPICEIISEKVTAELPSTTTGKVHEIYVEEGKTVPVGTVICTIEVEDTGAGDSTGSGGDRPAGLSSAGQQPAAAASRNDALMRSRISPVVRRLADEHGIDLDLIEGTGIGGRITRRDVMRAIESPPQVSVRSTGLHLKQPAEPQPQVVAEAKIASDREYILDVNHVRSAIAAKMRQSVSEIPHAWTMIEADVTNLVMLRNKLKDEFKRKEGVNLTYLAFVLKAVVNAIKEYPIMNSVWAVDKIIIKKDINISLAVGTEDAVYVPVIRNADQKTIAGLAIEIDELTRKAREGRLSPEEATGGTFTVNNTGSFGSILSYPIINYPQAANFTFESIVKRPVVINDMIAVRSMVNLCLSLDHRILDGVVCGRFLQRVKENLESFGPDTQLY
ncbi:lipoamide acyltransferase component of branched-chain alpha-keto acid dehydrogenase complex [Insulibacter thermoxylanivorax]|uniref:Dihydrolipoamide acetyltransferase component of pyruvate dehydrogenase complex n=2 Tax=Insulibacter thermoxylanivorax TaxID=2749268 RepID=A0A916QC32_9BACL|nr:lipoamide acyltransferase component of branched-chain alpha-keto acid dehydrogenase complex [Insulibacter thermoxylanivorax]